MSRKGRNGQCKGSQDDREARVAVREGLCTVGTKETLSG